MIAVEKLILIILFLVVLVFGIFLLIGYVLPTGNNINLQNELRECCTKYRAALCPTDATLGDIKCDQHYLSDLYNDFKFSSPDDLKSYCKCP